MRSIGGSWWQSACLVVLVVFGDGRGQEGQSSNPSSTQAPREQRQNSPNELPPPRKQTGTTGQNAPAKVDDLATRVKRLEQQNEELLRFLRQRQKTSDELPPPKKWTATDEQNTPAQVEDLATRVKRLEQQNEQLLRFLKKQSSGQNGGVQAPDSRRGEPGAAAPPGGQSSPDGAGAGGGGAGIGAEPDFREGEPGAAAPPSGASRAGPSGTATDQWFEIGKNLNLKARWVNFQPWLETNDGAFRAHAGGRTQLDAIGASAPDNVKFGKGGIGPFESAVNFRRARLEIDGWMYEYFDFWCEYDFVNSANVDPNLPATESNTINTPVPIEVWGSINFIPWLGTLRIGNQKNPIGLDHMISSRFLDFLERAPYFDIFINRNNGVQPGIELINWTANERFTWQIGVFKNNQNIFGWNVGNGEGEVNARVTWLPWYQYEGRYMIHLGFGVQYDEPDNATAVLRYRWLLRNGPPTLHSTVALASIVGHHQTLAAPEFFMNLGSLSVQAEYLINYLDQISSFTTQSQGTVSVPGGRKSYIAQTAYIQALYFLTGEYRPYYRTGIHHGGASPTRIVPNRNFFWLPGYRFNPFSAGAWQVGLRYAYTNLTNNGIFGGDVHEVTAGLNWFLTPNLKFQVNYDIGYRYDLGPLATSKGIFQGIGTRFAFDF